MKAPCHGCPAWEENFPKCAENCSKFVDHAKKLLLMSSRSPCVSCRCGMPNANLDKRKCCLKCPLPKIYSMSLGSGPPSGLGGGCQFARTAGKGQVYRPEQQS